MPIYETNIVPETNYIITTFETTQPVQSYLIAFTVSDFTYVEDTSGRVGQKIYAKPASIDNGDGAVALASSRTILEGFERYLGVLYALPKMDQAALPNFAAGWLVLA